MKKQKIKKEEIWKLDLTIAEFIVPRLKSFHKMVDGYPSNFNDLNEWKECINKMIWSFQYVLSRGNDPVTFLDSTMQKRYTEGMAYFSKYLMALWT